MAYIRSVTEVFNLWVYKSCEMLENYSSAASELPLLVSEVTYISHDKCLEA